MGFIGLETHIKNSLVGHLGYLLSILCIIYEQRNMFRFLNADLKKFSRILNSSEATIVFMSLLFSIKLNKADMNLDTNISIKFKNHLQSYTHFRRYRASIIALQFKKKTVWLVATHDFSLPNFTFPFSKLSVVPMMTTRQLCIALLY